MNIRLSLLAVACVAALLQPAGASGSASSAAGLAPDTPTMIEALRPAATPGMRNLVLRARPEPAASAAMDAAVQAQQQASESMPPQPAEPPSLSLAIQFEPNSAQVRPESGAVLGNLVAALLSPELKSVRFPIEGHTDASGHPVRNQALSQERAEEVRLYLVALGVHPSRLKAVGKGASQLANPLQPQAAENRRVRVVALE